MITYIIIIFFYIAPIILVVKTMSAYMAYLLVGIYIINTVFAIYYTMWRDQVASTTPKLSYRQFIALYNAMPEDFILNDYDIKYSGDAVDFKTFIDVMRYRRFHKNIECRQLRQNQLKNQAKLITNLQRGLAREQADIDYFMKEHIIK